MSKIRFWKLSFFVFYLTVPVLVFGVETTLGEADNFGELVSLIWSFGAKVILTLSVLTLIVSGFFYISAGGDGEKLNQSKNIGTGAIIAATLVLFSGVLQRLIQKPLQNISPGKTELTDLPNVIMNVSNLLLAFVGGFAAIVLIYNGIQYMLAKGELEKIEKAKKQTQYALIGLLVSVLAYYAIGFLIRFWTD